MAMKTASKFHHLRYIENYVAILLNLLKKINQMAKLLFFKIEMINNSIVQTMRLCLTMAISKAIKTASGEG
jgi:hypothetical protein